MTPDIRRLISLSSACILLLVVTTGFLVTFTGWLGVQSDIERVLADQTVPPAADPARYLSAGESHSVAGSNLQSRLNEAANNAGLTTGRVNIAPVDRNDPLAVILEFQATGEMEAIVRLLHNIESSLPALIVEEVRLTPVRSSSRLQLIATIRARREPGGRS